MVDVPWYMLSPSPVSLIQYVILSWILSRYLLKKVKYTRAPRIMSLIDSFFVVAFFVCITDGFWCLFTAIKWLPLHPEDFLIMGCSLGRDLLGAALFFLMIGGYFKHKILVANSTVVFWVLVCFISQVVWFLLAPSPGFTDYVYAWRHGYSFWIIISSWILSHFVMRIPLWIAILKTRSKLLK